MHERKSTLLDLGAELLGLVDRLAALEEAAQDTPEAAADIAAAEAEVNAELDALVGAIGDKVDAYCDVLREFTLRAEALAEEEKRYRRKRQVAERAAERLKTRLLLGLEAMGLSEVAGTRWTVKMAPSPPAVTVRDAEGAVAAGYGVLVTEAKPDRAAILAAWKKDPASVAAFADVTRGAHLRIR